MQLFNSQFAIGRSCIIKICFRRHELLSTQKCSYTSFCILNRRRQLFTAQSSNTIKGIKLRHLDKINLHRNCSRSSFPFAPTIFSLSSGHGKCGVAVVRVSGPAVSLALQEIAQFRTMPTPRKATLRRLVDPVTGVEIDRALVLYFPGPHSFTGEDCAEFQVHGGPAIVAALLSALANITSCRQAEPGEFTKRAFMNGKLDLTEVEGLGDLIHAETEAQRKQALRQMEGSLSKLYQRWRAEMIKCVADLEAFIDFSEDQDLEEEIVAHVIHKVMLLRGEIKQHLDDNRQGERLREGVHVVIVGKPNVGKSSLLNAICQRPAAIVTEIAGTTRDVIETHVNIGGYPVLLSDTAGLRETTDAVEKEGVARAVARATQSDLKVLMVDLADICSLKLTPGDISARIQELCDLGKWNNESYVTNTESLLGQKERNHIEMKDSIIVFNKSDLVDSDTMQYLRSELQTIQTMLASSSGSHGNKDLHGNRRDDDQNLYCNFDKCEQFHHWYEEEKGFRFTGDYTGINSGQSINNMSIDLQEDGKKRGQDFEYQSALCVLSCETGEGLEEFLEILKAKVVSLCGNPLSGHPSITQSRHRSLLLRCQEHLDHFRGVANHGDIVLASEALRRALREIGKLTGKVTTEEILDVIFRDFCIGK